MIKTLHASQSQVCVRTSRLVIKMHISSCLLWKWNAEIDKRVDFEVTKEWITI